MLDSKNLTIEEFSEKINSDESAIIHDLRTFEEYSKGHITNSLLVDIYHPTYQKKIMELDKSKNYYIYCRIGSRRYHAGYFILQMGFEKVSHLQDGIIAWKDNLEI